MTATATADVDDPVRAVDLRKGDRVWWAGRWRHVISAAHHDADGLSLIRFRDGRWLHCDPDQRLERQP